jgi:hypothetical protein
MPICREGFSTSKMVGTAILFNLVFELFANIPSSK